MRSCLAPFTVSKQSKSCSLFVFAVLRWPSSSCPSTSVVSPPSSSSPPPSFTMFLIMIARSGEPVEGLAPRKHCDPARHHPHQDLPHLRLRVPLHWPFPGEQQASPTLSNVQTRFFQFLAPTNPSGFLVCQGLSEHSLQRCWCWRGFLKVSNVQQLNNCNNCTIAQLQQLHIHQNFSLCGNSYEKAFTTSASYWACCKVKQGQWITWSKVIMQQNQTHRSVWSVTVCYLITVANLVGRRPDNRKNLQK